MVSSIRVLCVAIVLSAAAQARAVDLSGDWIGTNDMITVYCEVPPVSSGPASVEIVQSGDTFTGTYVWTGLNPELCVQATEPSSVAFQLVGTVAGDAFQAVVFHGPRQIGTMSGSVTGNAMTFTLIIPLTRTRIDSIITARLTRTPSVAIGTLWPPNHRMVDVGLTIDAASTFAVYSDEDDGATSDATGSLLLRAERAGTGDGRVYLIVVTGADGSQRCITAVVPKSQSAADIASVNAQAQAALQQCPMPAGFVLVGN